MSLPDIRQTIDALDTDLLKLLAQRFQLSKQAASLKSSIRDIKREDEILAKYRREAVSLGLSPAFAEDLLSRILTESRRLQSSAL